MSTGQGEAASRLTGISNNDIQSISNLLDFFNSLLVAFFIVGD